MLKGGVDGKADDLNNNQDMEHTDIDTTYLGIYGGKN